MEIRVIGLGYIGLPTAIILSKSGHSVVGYDIDDDKVEKVNSGISPVEEPEIEKHLKQEIKTGNLKASKNLKKGEAYFISVQTPLKENKKEADLSHLKSALNPLEEKIENEDIIVIESTTPPKTTEELYKEIQEQTGKSPYMAHCPERVMPGKIMEELKENPRIVGGVNKESTEKVTELFKTFVNGKIHKTDSRTSEVVKLMENIYRDINIAATNEIGLICQELGINAFEAIKIANSHPRVNYLKPGAGVGGHCLPKDPYLLLEKTKQEKGIIKTSRKRNEKMPQEVTKIIKNTFKNLKNKKIGILGIAYKAGTDDKRNSPAIKIGKTLQNQGAEIAYYDPYIKGNIENVFKNSVTVIIATDHKEFQKINFQKYKNLMKKNILIDGRGMLQEPPKGFKMFGIGRGDLTKNQQQIK